MSNREAMPAVAKIVDAFRAEFGDVKVTYCKEGGIEKGKRGEVGVVPVLPVRIKNVREAR